MYEFGEVNVASILHNWEHDLDTYLSPLEPPPSISSPLFEIKPPDPPLPPLPLRLLRTDEAMQPTVLLLLPCGGFRALFREIGQQCGVRPSAASRKWQWRMERWKKIGKGVILKLYLYWGHNQSRYSPDKAQFFVIPKFQHFCSWS